MVTPTATIAKEYYNILIHYLSSDHIFMTIAISIFIMIIFW